MMIDAANRQGFTGYDTIRHSQELDCLMNAYQQLVNRDRTHHQGIQV